PLGTRISRVALWPLGTRGTRVSLRALGSCQCRQLLRRKIAVGKRRALLPLGACISFRSLWARQRLQLFLGKILIGERVPLRSLGACRARLAFWSLGACLARFSSGTLGAGVTFITFPSLWTHFAPQRTRRPILVFVFIKEPQDIVFLCPYQIRLTRNRCLRLRKLIGACNQPAQVKAGSLVSLFPLQAGQPVRFRSLKPM